MRFPLLHIEQALFNPHLSDESRRWVISPGFHDEWRAEAERLAGAFAVAPTDNGSTEALFAQPFGREYVAVVTVTSGPPRFHFRIVSRRLYEYLGDPFLIAERYPSDWTETRELPTGEWPEEPIPPRTVGDLQTVLKEGNGPLLLAATQVLVDGGRLMVPRTAPDPKLLHDVWALLPQSTRAEVWPATFAIDAGGLDLHAVVVPQMPDPVPEGFLTEDQALDYPDSRYERNLQIAIEDGDQVSLNRLLSRRSSSQTLRLALILVVVFMVLSLAMKILQVR